MSEDTPLAQSAGFLANAFRPVVIGIARRLRRADGVAHLLRAGRTTATVS